MLQPGVDETVLYIYRYEFLGMFNIKTEIYLEGKGVTGGCWRGVLSPGAFSGMFHIYIYTYMWKGRVVPPGVVIISCRL